jgi:hypothetical protein
MGVLNTLALDETQFVRAEAELAPALRRRATVFAH